MQTAAFREAKPVWPALRQHAMNDFVGFRASVQVEAGQRATLRLTASTLYRAFLNGEFVGYGPPRAPHGKYRVDEIPLRLRPGRNEIAIEVAGYNVNSYYILDQPSFLQAEIVSGGKVLAATGRDFAAIDLTYRVRKVVRYSFQRPFIEVYRLDSDSLKWREGKNPLTLPCEQLQPKELIPSGVNLCTWDIRGPRSHFAHGTFSVDPAPKDPYKDRSMTQISATLKGFTENELETTPNLEVQSLRMSMQPDTRGYQPQEAIRLSAGACHAVDFGQELSGFLRWRIHVTTPCRLFITFDEIPTKGDIPATRIDIMNLVVHELQPGEYELETFESYSLRYAKFSLLEGECQITQIGLREYANPDVRASFACADPKLNCLFAAAAETFRQNTADILTDCPSRERAGWLCDSFFSSRTSFDLTGSASRERMFLENFLLAPSLKGIPDAMLPMCYPADHPDGTFIPQWSMWFIVQLEEYLARSGDRAFVDAWQKKIFALLNWFEPYHNTDGLLEKLPSWNFIEWSFANECTRDVNYPTNMLWAAALDAVARLYDRPALAERANAIRKVVLAQSWDGAFFVDNAIRQADGSLEPTRNRTEVCQYFAFFFGVASPASHPELWRKLSCEFGPQRRQNNLHPEIHFANAIVGNYLRLELLSRSGQQAQLADEMIGYFHDMALATGTLWEHTDHRASCNHGFASHVVRWITRDVLGVQEIDQVRRRITIRVPATPLVWAQASLPVGASVLHIRWQRNESGVAVPEISPPAGYSVTIG